MLHYFYVHFLFYRHYVGYAKVNMVLVNLKGNYKSKDFEKWCIYLIKLKLKQWWMNYITINQFFFRNIWWHIHIECQNSEYFEEVNFPTHCYNINNIVKASIRIFKDIVLEICTAFNATTLIDLICKILEDSHKRRLIKFSLFPVKKFEIISQHFYNKVKSLK